MVTHSGTIPKHSPRGEDPLVRLTVYLSREIYQRLMKLINQRLGPDGRRAQSHIIEQALTAYLNEEPDK
jgi:predicted transcriptional regulator